MSICTAKEYFQLSLDIEKRESQAKHWRMHGRELNQIYSAICDALTWKQFQRWQLSAPDTYRRRFEAALHVSRKPQIAELVRRGLALCATCETAQETPKCPS